MAAQRDTLFDDIFVVKERDPEGKFFDKVSRYVCRSDLYEADLAIDINIDLYPLEVNEKFKLLLTPTLMLDNSKGSDNYDPELFTKKDPKASKMDQYEYVMHGKVFKFQEGGDAGPTRVSVFVSFGGLLMRLTADAQNLKDIEVDSTVFLLMRKV